MTTDTPSPSDVRLGKFAMDSAWNLKNMYKALWFIARWSDVTAKLRNWSTSFQFQYVKYYIDLLVTWFLTVLVIILPPIVVAWWLIQLYMGDIKIANKVLAKKYCILQEQCSLICRLGCSSPVYAYNNSIPHGLQVTIRRCNYWWQDIQVVG